MEINKVVYNGDTLLDLTSDTVTPQTLLSGTTAHAANGQSISGAVDLRGKADKVANATAGNFAGLDSSGNLTDSNKSAADFATASDMTAVQGIIPSTATTQNKLATVADTANKVDKVAGKGLSTEDYTTAEKTKLGTVETNATANTVINTSCTLAANGWTGASAPYTQTVNVASIQSTDHAYVDLSVSSTTATGIDEIENWAYISKVESGTGTLTFTCYEDKPDIDLNVNVQVVRGTNTGGGSPVETVLYDNVNLATVGAVNVACNLTQAYTNFDEVRVEYAYVYTPTAGNNKIYPIINTYTVDELEAMRTSLYADRKGYILFISISDMYIALDITTTSQFTVIDVRNSSSYNQYITKITGIKY